MDKKDFLNYKDLVLEVEQLRARIETLEGPRSPILSGMPRVVSPRGDSMVDVVEQHKKLIDQYAERLAEAEARLLVIEQAIASLEDPVERVIMRERYVRGWPWRRICATLAAEGYSERQVYRLHGFALLKLKEF